MKKEELLRYLEDLKINSKILDEKLFNSNLDATAVWIIRFYFIDLDKNFSLIEQKIKNL